MPYRLSYPGPLGDTKRIFLCNLQSEKCLHENGRAMPRRLAAGLLLRNPSFRPGPVDVTFGTGTGFSRSTSVFLVNVITKTPHTLIHSQTTLNQNRNQNLPTKVTVFGNKESSRQNNTLISFSLQNVNVASKRHSLGILHCLMEEKNMFRRKAVWGSSCAQNTWSGFHQTSVMWCAENPC